MSNFLAKSNKTGGFRIILRLDFTRSEYNPKIAADRRIKEMLPVLTEKKDRIKYINSLVEAFGNKEVLETFETKERLEGLPPKEVLKNLNLENLTSEDIKSLNKNDREALKKMLMDN